MVARSPLGLVVTRPSNLRLKPTPFGALARTFGFPRCGAIVTQRGAA